MPIRLDDRDARFEQQFQALLSAKREVSEEVDRVVADIIADVREQGDAAVLACTSRFDQLELTADTLRVSEAEIDDGARVLPARAAGRARNRARPHRGLSRPAKAGGRLVQRRARCRERLALERDRGCRPLRSRRHGELSLLRADECGAGQGGGRAARGDGGADAAGRNQPAGARRRPAGRCRRGLPDRRSPGRRRAGLRHGQYRARRQDRRPRKRLCRRRQAPGLRPGRHRHDRRPLRGAGHRRQHRQPGLDRSRSAGPGRA